MLQDMLLVLTLQCSTNKQWPSAFHFKDICTDSVHQSTRPLFMNLCTSAAFFSGATQHYISSHRLQNLSAEETVKHVHSSLCRNSLPSCGGSTLISSDSSVASLISSSASSSSSSSLAMSWRASLMFMPSL